MGWDDFDPFESWQTSCVGRDSNLYHCFVLYWLLHPTRLTNVGVGTILYDTVD